MGHTVQLDQQRPGDPLMRRGGEVLVVVAHPDDETLGAGGTIARLSRHGLPIHCISMTNGTGARGADRSEADQRRQAFIKACDKLGITSSAIHSFDDQRLDSCALLDITQAIEEWAKEYKPSVVLTHSASDLNKDHRILLEAVMTAFRPYRSTIELVASFEVCSTTEVGTLGGRAFNPTLFIDIEETLDVKLQALAYYTSEIGEFPHPRSIQTVSSLARHRGAVCGYVAAEAFEVHFLGLGKRSAMRALFESPIIAAS